MLHPTSWEVDGRDEYTAIVLLRQSQAPEGEILTCQKPSDLNAGHYITNPHFMHYSIWEIPEHLPHPDAPCMAYLPTFHLNFMVNVGIYSIHGAYGLHLHCLILPERQI